jgi:hypothetical protein
MGLMPYTTMLLPTEIIDEIILRTDFQTAILLNNEYAIKKLYVPKKHTFDFAASEGHLEILKWLHKNTVQKNKKNIRNPREKTEGCSTDAMDAAASEGHLDVVKWLHENRTEGCTKYAMDEAARNGHLDVIKWFARKYGQSPTPRRG